jgi:hypothetical protein
MKISYEGDNAKLRAAAAYVNVLAANESFWKEIREKDSFTHTELSPVQIAHRIRSGSTTMNVRVWSPNLLQQFTYRNTVAFTDPGAPQVLFYHDKFLGNDIAEMVNTLTHEYIHDIDGHSDGSPMTDMGHGDNSPKGKENSAPYWIGDLAEKFYRLTAHLSPQVKGLRLIREVGKASDGEVVYEPKVPLKAFDQEAAAAGVG